MAVAEDIPPLLTVTFESNPLDKIADSKVGLQFESLLVTLHLPVLLRLGTFFGSKTSGKDMHAFEAAAYKQLANVKK